MTTTSRPLGIVCLNLPPGLTPWGTTTINGVGAGGGAGTTAPSAPTWIDWPASAPIGTVTATFRPSGIVNLNLSPGLMPSGTTTVTGVGADGGGRTNPLAATWIGLPAPTPGGHAIVTFRPSGIVNLNLPPGLTPTGTTTVIDGVGNGGGGDNGGHGGDGDGSGGGDGGGGL